MRVLTHLSPSPGYRRPPSPRLTCAFRQHLFFFFFSFPLLQCAPWAPEWGSPAVHISPSSRLTLSRSAAGSDVFCKSRSQRVTWLEPLVGAKPNWEEAHQSEEQEAGKNAWPVGVADRACLISWPLLMQKSAAFL